MKGREMDERIARMLEIAKAADQALEPLKPMMERLKPVYEALNSHPLLAIKQLRAPTFLPRERNGPSPAIEHQAHQSNDTNAEPTPSAAISADAGRSIETDQRTRRTRKDPFAEALNEALSSNPDASPIKVKKWIVEHCKPDIQFRDSDQTFTWVAMNGKTEEMNGKAFVARIGRWKRAQK